ncbi:hypothetical protein XBFM1_2370022 [Xenorhabdus bovienii str. feltiae Moldova]|uniref:Uncharacterized protein n=1 Tax=Xenorhabdus bovienii str. feltiae Moldova TaxID=1398200 RepID=A0A077NSQ3_XENBV|nr:hypothetical protein XBFM1_2370022 [Xenorhabdus bovienii str. feltiae Moldova]
MSYAVREFADDDKIDFKREAYFCLLLVEKKLSVSPVIVPIFGLTFI